MTEKWKDERLRFGGISRLYGPDGYAALQNAHVCIIGVGGVGSWAAEALARSAIGKLTLVDLDDVGVSNVNRQVQALDGTVGKTKIGALRERFQLINPDIEVIERHEFFTERTADDILSTPYDAVIDGIDRVKFKCLMIDRCKQAGIHIVTVGSAGGRKDPTKISNADLGFSYNDPLLAKVRKMLRKDYGYPKGSHKNMGVDCIFSPEPLTLPQIGDACETKVPHNSQRLDCDSGYGTTTFLSGAIGFAAAGRVVDYIVARTKPSGT